ncbi:OF BC1 COMPLEX KINASE 3, chloroplastic [Seminavis robusta]|uniref:OF BC1 COMPLEX KINASE 3, chloroplastic n=1 Tax=Seminavis robusta TaxID=568900 RepID=A0A9N8EH34_9STRA|nr:OF BC1 COMPLEX KINASE 3, chloroplastic [Seminavis robusta]|eukprot:Sro1070_g237800.1 OF BC1 COMPLEX KINASE 3, chloroplastic (956) ;mRNA; f:27008-30448
MKARPVRSCDMQRIPGPPSLLAVLGVVGLLTVRPTTAFVRPPVTRISSVPEPRKDSLGLSLNDDWADLTSRLAGATAKVTTTIPTVPNDNVASPQPSLGLFFDTDDFVSSLIKPALSSLESTMAETSALILALPLVAKVGLALLPLAAVLFTVLYNMALAAPDDFRQGMEPYARGMYDPIQAKAYYSRHQLLVLQRASQVFRLSNGFLYNLLFDKYILRDEETNRVQRAEELLALVTKLGPTAIKIGQALSVRPDLIPAEYAKALSSLQDQVPPFDGQAAKDILRLELGPEKYSHLKDFPFMSRGSGPVASASIGQVYRGFIDSQEVAVKVQRPNVLAEIALDLHLVREFAPLYKKLTRTASDLQGLTDEWGRGFIAELDYRREAASTIRFTEEMQKRNLNAVSAPTVITDYSTEQILVTEWIDGVRIDKSDADDVPRLCAVALNAYLVMLLELQSLHCDPHPGNLLRTKDGTLIILDFGMTLDIDPSLQYSLLEYVAHLTSNDYDKLPEDLVALGFLKEEKLDFVRRSGVLEPLKYFLRQAGEGGGAKKVRNRIFAEYREKFPGLSDDELRVEMRSEMKARVQDMAEREGAVTGLTVEVEDLQRRNRDSFRIPEWFLYTSRAFLTLEGVSLQADEDFSIIKSCFPYVAKRLLVDDSPRAQDALRELLYGAENQIDSKRLVDLADGFSTYTTTTKETQLDNGLVLDGQSDESPARPMTLSERKNRLAETEATVTLAKNSADILLSREGSLVQTLLLEESVRATSAQIKDELRNLLVDGPKKFRDTVPFGSFLPPLPFEEQLAPFVGKSEEEIRAQQLAEKVLSLVSQQQLDKIRNGGSSEDSNSMDSSPPAALSTVINEVEPEQLAILSRELRESAPRYLPLVGLLGAKFSSALLETASDNIDAALASLEQDSNGRNPAEELTKVTARGLSTIAKRGASTITDQVVNTIPNDGPN